VTRVRWWAIAAAGLLGIAGGCKFDFPISARSARIVEFEQANPDAATLGMARLAFDDFGSLNNHTLTTNAMPYKVVVTALVLLRAEREGAAVAPIDAATFFRRYGWITPRRVSNWPGDSPSFDKPLGMVAGEFRNKVAGVRLEVANIGCATCHAGITYDADGRPQPEVAWFGAPNTSRDFDAYLGDIFAALRAAALQPEAFLDALPKVFPAIEPDEARTIRRIVLPEIRNRLAASGELSSFLPFDNGGPGLTNGVAALKLQLSPDRRLLSSKEHGYVSIPDLHGRTLRTSWLADGVYAADPARRFEPREAPDGPVPPARGVASIVAFFLVPTTGIRPGLSDAQAVRVGDVLAFLRDYRPPPFPGRIDLPRAGRGAVVYERRCAECHGTYVDDNGGMRLARFPNRLVPQEAMRTDAARWQAVTQPAIESLGRLPVSRKVNAARTGGYVAPILAGVWMTAPYLHNGSVPTLWHLMRPASRPAAFPVGGHALDFERVGIALATGPDDVLRYPEGFVPWAGWALHDTSQPGKSSGGHQAPFDVMAESEKDDLLEYLKRL
jgi:hypothetical protein